MLEDELIRCGALKFGNFLLSSGKKSNLYVDIKKASTKYKILNLMGDLVAPHVRGDLMAGVELGAVPLLAITSIKSKRDYLIIRKNNKEYGTSSLIEGDFKRGQVVDIIEDVVTTGNSVIYAIRILRERGLRVKRVICVVDREEGGKENLKREKVELISLLTVSDLLNLYSRKFLHQDQSGNYREGRY